MTTDFDQKVLLSRHDRGWVLRFEAEAALLRAANLPGMVDLQHIGSTAIPGLQAKPILDLALATHLPARTPRLIRAIASLGYRHLGNYGLRGRQFFRKGDPTSIHLHVVQERSPLWREWITFRDVLISHPHWAKIYEREKLHLARVYADDRAAYTAGKNTIIRHILAEAKRKHPQAGSYQSANTF